jgi:DNA-binding LacI/PurR family transcriptional regulator
MTGATALAFFSKRARVFESVENLGFRRPNSMAQTPRSLTAAKSGPSGVVISPQYIIR